MSKHKSWSDISDATLEALDVRAEYEALGVTIVGRQESPSGWLTCRAVSREDKRPSAAINVGPLPLRGRYKDLGGSGESIGFWDFAAKYGQFSDWREARKHYAVKAGVAGKDEKNLPKVDEKRQIDSLDFHERPMPPQLFRLHIRGLLKAYPGITAEALLLCGARICTYPKGSKYPRYCVALPCYGPHLLDGGAQGYVIMATDGGMIQLFQGEGNPTKPEKKLTMGQSGIVGPVKEWRKVKRVVKCEGISDMLIMNSLLIGAGGQPETVAVTNSCGAGEKYVVDGLSPLFTGKEVAVVHDADEAGEDGAKVWTGKLTGTAARVWRSRLPFDVTASKGKDLRDFICEH